MSASSPRARGGGIDTIIALVLLLVLLALLVLLVLLVLLPAVVVAPRVSVENGNVLTTVVDVDRAYQYYKKQKSI